MNARAQQNAIGIYLAKRGMFATSAVAFKRVLNEQDEPGVRVNYANVLRRLWRFDEARAEITQVLEDNDFSRFVRASIQLETNDPVGAVEWMERLEKQTPHFRFCTAMAALQAGQWEKGFGHYEARLELNKPPPAALPKWEGQEGIVLAHHEQGYGDSIMFSRFLRYEPHNTHFVFSVPSPLYRLFHQSGFDTLNTNSRIAPEAQYIAPLMSLPHRLGMTDIETLPPYIRAIDRYPLPTPAGTRLKVGIVWTAKANSQPKGMEETLHGWQKSIPLEALLPLATIPGVSLYALQTGEAAKDVERIGADALMTNLGNAIMDFADMASFMASMDVIVSVDTAPLHLAGALGKKAFGLLSYPRSWQWGTQAQTPWYASIETIQQPRPFDWEGAVETLCNKVAAL